MIHIELPDDFNESIRKIMEHEQAILNGNFRLVLEDKVIFGLCYAEALDRAKQAIANAGYTVWDCEYYNDWMVEYFVETDDDFVLFATVESELQS